MHLILLGWVFQPCSFVGLVFVRSSTSGVYVPDVSADAYVGFHISFASISQFAVDNEATLQIHESQYLCRFERWVTQNHAT